MLLTPPATRARTRSLLRTSRPALASSPVLRRLELEYVSLSDLKLSKVKLRKHSERQIEHLAGCLKRFGCVLPIPIARGGHPIDGEAVLEAARRVGLAELPIVRIDDLGDAEVRALRIALNQLSTLSSWDEAILKSELEFLSSFDIELPTFTGFSSAEIDFYTAKPSKSADDLEAGGQPLLRKLVITRRGDIWHFKGGHKLACLDTLDEASFATLLADERAGLVASDPPYNVKIRGHVTDRTDAREFAMAAGEMSAEEFTEFLTTSLRHSAAYARDGALSLQFMDWRHIDEMMTAGKEVYGRLFNLAVWSKTNPGMGSPWRSGHELCFVWKKGTVAHVDNVRLGRVGRNRSNVWCYPGANQHRDRGSEGHVTPKNLAMIQDAILDVSIRDDIVLDAFAGSGTTLVAAHLARRRGYGLEIDPAYVDLAVRRMEARTKAPARHAETGLTFAEVAAERGLSLPSSQRDS